MHTCLPWLLTYDIQSKTFLVPGNNTSSPTLRAACKLQVFENRLLRNAFGTRNDEVNNLGYYIMRGFVIYTGHLILLGGVGYYGRS